MLGEGRDCRKALYGRSCSTRPTWWRLDCLNPNPQWWKWAPGGRSAWGPPLTRARPWTVRPSHLRGKDIGQWGQARGWVGHLPRPRTCDDDVPRDRLQPARATATEPP